MPLQFIGQTVSAVLSTKKNNGSSHEAVARTAPKNCAQNDSNQMDKNQLNGIMPATQNIGSDSVLPTSPEHGGRGQSNTPDVTIVLTPYSNVALKKSTAGQKSDERSPQLSTPVTPKNVKRLPKAKVSIFGNITIITLYCHVIIVFEFYCFADH